MRNTILSHHNSIYIYRQLPVPYGKANGSALPLPATVQVTRRATGEKRGIPVLSSNGGQSIAKYPSGTPSSENSRPNSPPDFNKSGLR
jgi:hypothetical protein